MGGLYNLVIGDHGIGPVLIAVLREVQPFDVGRYRDAWPEIDGDRVLIRVHTRNGGGNREGYDDGSMQEHPWYLRDEDMEFDNTYADYYFVPDPAKLGNMALDVFEAVMPAIVTMAEPHADVPAKWAAAIEAIAKAASTPMPTTVTPPTPDQVAKFAEGQLPA